MAASGRRNADFALLTALAAGRPVVEAAKLAGVGERTVYRRLEDADFRRQLSALRGQMLERAVGMLADGAGEAAGILRTLAAKARSESVRLSASRAVLELGAKLREATELEERIAALEAQAQRGPERMRA